MFGTYKRQIQNVQPGWSFYPPFCSIGTVGTGVKRLGREGNHLPPSSARVKNEWSYTSAYHACLCGLDREHFTF